MSVNEGENYQVGKTPRQPRDETHMRELEPLANSHANESRWK